MFKQDLSTEEFNQSGRFYHVFYKASEFITSLALVIIFLFLFMAYRFYEVQTLFFEKLPADLVGNSRLIASNIFALVFIFTTLLFMVNSGRSLKWGKFILALIALVINIYFWKAFSGTSEDIIFKLFISAVIAGMDYGFAHLFDTMWKERLKSYQIADLQQNQNDIEQTISELEQDEITLKEQIATLEQKLQQAEQDLSKRIAKLDELACPHCGKQCDSIKALNGHLGQCKQRKRKNI